MSTYLVEIDEKDVPALEQTVLVFSNGKLYKKSKKDGLVEFLASIGGDGGANGTVKFKKNPALTSADVGKLAMQTVEQLVQDPQSLEDFKIEAVVADTTPLVPGIKGVYRIQIGGTMLIEPKTKIIKVEFLNQPQSGYGILFTGNQLGNIGLLKYKRPDENIGTDEIYIGATIAESIQNMVDYVNLANSTLTNTYIRVDNYDKNAQIPFIEFEMLYNYNDEYQKYSQETNIATDTLTNNFDSNIAFQTFPDIAYDAYNNVVNFEFDENDNGDGYYQLLRMNDADVVISAFNAPGTIFKNASNELYKKTGGQYNQVTGIYRYADGKIGFNDAVWTTSITDIAPFPQWFPIEGVFQMSVSRTIDVNAANRAQFIYNMGSSYIIGFQSWDSNNGSQGILTYNRLFRNDSGQPFGTFGAFGLKYYDNPMAMLSALHWAVTNDPNFPTLLDIVAPFAELDQLPGTYEMTVTNKTAPGTTTNSYFQSNTNYDISINTFTDTGALAGRPERVSNLILGRIAGVEGDYVLIDNSPILKLKMASQADGCFGALPYTEEFNLPQQGGGGYIPMMIAWRHGTVIDLAGYYTIMQDTGFDVYGNGGGAMIFPYIAGGLFRPLSAGLPDGGVLVDARFTQFGN